MTDFSKMEGEDMRDEILRLREQCASYAETIEALEENRLVMGDWIDELVDALNLIYCAADDLIASEDEIQAQFEYIKRECDDAIKKAKGE